MLKSLSTAATGMTAQEKKMDVIAHNLANANTTGFRRSRLEFEEIFVERLRGAGTTRAQGAGGPTTRDIGLGVRAVGTSRSLAQGQMVATDQPFDLAIEGRGLFPIQRSNGEIAYTRAGNFRLDALGRIVTQRGELLDANIEVPQDATSVTIQRDGEVLAVVPGRTDPVSLGQIEVAVFPSPENLASIGGNLLVETEASGQPTLTQPGSDGSGELAQGFLETSNVQAVTEMIAMITTQRAYEMNSKVIQAADQMLGRLTNLR